MDHPSQTPSETKVQSKPFKKRFQKKEQLEKPRQHFAKSRVGLTTQHTPINLPLDYSGYYEVCINVYQTMIVEARPSVLQSFTINMFMAHMFMLLANRIYKIAKIQEDFVVPASMEPLIPDSLVPKPVYDYLSCLGVQHIDQFSLTLRPDCGLNEILQLKYNALQLLVHPFNGPNLTHYRFVLDDFGTAPEVIFLFYELKHQGHDVDWVVFSNDPNASIADFLGINVQNAIALVGVIQILLQPAAPIVDVFQDARVFFNLPANTPQALVTFLESLLNRLRIYDFREFARSRSYNIPDQVGDLQLSASYLGALKVLANKYKCVQGTPPVLTGSKAMMTFIESDSPSNHSLVSYQELSLSEEEDAVRFRFLAREPYSWPIAAGFRSARLSITPAQRLKDHVVSQYGN